MSAESVNLKNESKEALQRKLEFYKNLIDQHETGRKCLSNSSPLNIQGTKLLFKHNSQSRNLKSNYSGNTSFLSNNMQQKKFSNKRVLPLISQSSKRMKVLTTTNDKLECVGSINVKNVPLIYVSKKANSLNDNKTNENCANLKNVNQDNSQISVLGKKTKELVSQQLIGELVAVTQQLKQKTKTLNAADKIKSSLVMTQRKHSHRLSNNPYLLQRYQLSKSPKQFSKNLSLTGQTMKILPNSVKVQKSSCDKNLNLPYYSKSNQIPHFGSHLNTANSTKHLELSERINSLKKYLASAKSTGSKFVGNEILVQVDTSAKEQSLTTNVSCGSTLCAETGNKIDLKKSSLNQFVNLPNNKNTNYKSESTSNPVSTKFVPKVSSCLKSKYKVINKVQTLKAPHNKDHTTISTKKYKSSTCVPKKKYNTFKVINNEGKLSKYQIQTTPKKCSSSFNKSTSSIGKRKSRRSLNISSWNHFSLTPKSNSCKRSSEVCSQLDADVDVDLLLELAAENKMMHVKPKRIFKSKSTIINNHTPEVRMAKMIKSKYFSSIKKIPKHKNTTKVKYFKGYSRSYTPKQSNTRNKTRKINFRPVNSFSNKYYASKLCAQKIVNVEGQKFIVGSSGKSLKILTKQTTSKKIIGRKTTKFSYIRKSSTPISKKIVNRALNRSSKVNLASVKKNQKKVNTYCMFYNRFGRCNKGVQCPYVHDPCRIAVCTRFLRGTCKNEKCLFSHEVNPGKMAICSFFLQDTCTKENCPYRHEKLTPDSVLCKAFVQGYCPQGKECKKAHILICPKYVQGICEKGKDCAFPHPVVKDKKPLLKTPDLKKTDDQIVETVCRYFQSSLNQDNLLKGSVVPKRKTLPEQPSFISLNLDETS